MAATFKDRLDAGRKLADAIGDTRGTNAVLLGLARGGVVVGYAVAEALGLPLSALVVRKIGAPQNPELAIGAVSETGVQWLDSGLVRATGASDSYIAGEVAAQVGEARRRQAEYGTGPGLETVRDRVAVVVDDGIATGATALVAVRSARGLSASRVILATPVASRQAVDLLSQVADRVVAVATPDPFIAVGLYYEDFQQVTDTEVKWYLHLAGETRRPAT
jgi:putative phosphoribosyl transferase